MKIGLALTPRVDPIRGLAGLFEDARGASAHGCDTLLIGDKQASAPEIHSNGVILATAIAQRVEFGSVGLLYLAPDWPAHQLLASGRSLVEVAEWRGTNPFIVLATGRPSDLPGSGTRAERMESRLHALKADPTCQRAELWIAAEYGRALQRAGRWATVWLANAHHPLPTLGSQLAAVNRAADSRSCPPRAAVRRDIVCAETDARAERLARDALAAGYRGGTVPREALIVGSPESCRRQIGEVGALGFDQVLLRPVRPEATERRSFLEVFDAGGD